jgi:hypothetical protein
MQTFKLILFQNLRRAAIVMGLAMFIMFAHKATNEVANTNIAAGNQRQQTLVAISSSAKAINSGVLTGEQSPAYLTSVQTSTITEPVPLQNNVIELSDNRSTRGAPDKSNAAHRVPAVVNSKSRGQ